MITGACGARALVLGPRGRAACGDAAARVDYATLRVESAGEYEVAVTAQPVYRRVRGPRHRLDVRVTALGDPAAAPPTHGLLGQGQTGPPRHGAVDVYPRTGTYVTRAWAEGAIDGAPSDYEVPHAHAVDAAAFAFSRWTTDAARAAKAAAAKAAART